ncbi:bifunctional diaminohydroxyphosphoribosylaminopyrimidine deaminase/5-amino-6-(5-phosphoribosylamino)uracil reductase RibD [Sphingorhabdus sp. Alg239-R122]|uniref:bifunctional diaminohydroxyphosphoribosylaminopyrimidine deaminase/5-amino-6-(5-phosphoribosylamino)uracil reductase RibD n=1 Tax=Sphingorhabdus sp. Alg239-R122 TaxID=2305989 RepID=UPI001967D30D|nr:bifunctional diaminohydroxyphosphoribosylaminopyrimidine deaminase/5-amino-6-(5-phosphoribosylamino)uracil reductase RibD [Sphingorhabdus sp. Alg239-R122]
MPPGHLHPNRPDSPLPSDIKYMRAALALANRARPLSRPNPGVGALVVKDGRIIGRGYTAAGGRPHAEAAALAQAGDAAHGADLYTTLEPCAHQSERGPSCSDTIITAGIARVIVGTKDSDPRTNGRGIEKLCDAGIAVQAGVCETDARRSLAGFFSVRERGRPHVTLKLATSLDGCIAMADGTSQWITGDAARAHTHLERVRHDAILVGGGTLRSDSPRLGVRLSGLEDRSPQRMVLTRGTAPEGWQVIQSPDDIGGLQDVQWLMVEGGAGAAASFLKAGLVDRLLIYRAPVLIGGGKPCLGDIGLEELADAHGQWQRTDMRALGDDVMESYERK